MSQWSLLTTNIIMTQKSKFGENNYFVNKKYLDNWKAERFLINIMFKHQEIKRYLFMHEQTKDHVFGRVCLQHTVCTMEMNTTLDTYQFTCLGISKYIHSIYLFIE